MNLKNRVFAVSTSVVMLSGLAAMLPQSVPVAYAAASYPVSEFQLAIGSTDLNVNATGSRLYADYSNGTETEEWSLNYVSSGVFEIVSSQNGELLTMNGTGIGLAADTDAPGQRWKIEGVQKDFDGYDLYYKITSNADAGKALTFSTVSNTFTLAKYQGDAGQKFKVNLDGITGFAGNCMCAEGEKAGTIGGLFGETVFVSKDTDLIKYLSDTKPYTIVLSGALDMTQYRHTRIRDNKTLVGAYGTATLQDCELRTNNEYGTEGDEPSDNIVIRNIDFLAKTQRGRILVQIWSSRQIWIDHCTFNSQLSRDVDEVGKFIWINTPYETYMDKKDRLRSPDYITLSYNIFRNRFWTVAYGTQNDEITRCRTSIMYDWWDQCVRRCPQIGNGNMHVVNNLYTGNDNGNYQSTDQIIGGDGCDIVSESCRFQSFDGHQITAGSGGEPVRDTGSYTSKKSTDTPTPLNYKPKVTSKWYPNKSNYGYTLMDAYNTNGTDVKAFCMKYAGRFKNAADLKYITDSDLAAYAAVTYPAPFLEHSDVRTAALTMDTSVPYMFRNAGSGLYLSVEDGKAANGTNVQQDSAQDRNAGLWYLAEAGDGYYYLYAAADPEKNICLDVPYGSADNGTSIGIWANDETDAKKFCFLDNGDGTVTIATKASDLAGCLGVHSDSTKAGADVIQWTRNGNDSQKWIAEQKFELLDGVHILDFDRLDTAHALQWSIASGVKTGDLIYGDREVTFAALPAELADADYIRPACDAKNLDQTLGTFAVKKDSIVSVAMDNRVTQLPAWLSDYEKTGLTVTGSNDVIYTVYQKAVSAGETVTLGTNGQSSGCVNYIAWVGDSERIVSGDVNADGKLTVADAVMLQRWLLCTDKLTDPQAADLNGDGRLDARDLSLLKRILF